MINNFFILMLVAMATQNDGPIQTENKAENQFRFYVNADENIPAELLEELDAIIEKFLQKERLQKIVNRMELLRYMSIFKELEGDQ
jgi:hypothetical protein